MREILFRGKRVYNGKWVEGSLIVTYYDDSPQEAHIRSLDTKNNCWGNLYEVDSETVGQYTGLKDKEGKRIFEGDCIRSNTTTYTVDCGRDMLDFKISGCKDSWRVRQRLSFASQASRLEIIGNIHDNPELLET